MMEESGAGSVLVTNGSGYESYNADNHPNVSLSQVFVKKFADFTEAEKNVFKLMNVAKSHTVTS
jgi:hypothetical protein